MEKAKTIAIEIESLQGMLGKLFALSIPLRSVTSGEPGPDKVLAYLAAAPLGELDLKLTATGRTLCN